jgi:MFS family permease
LILDSLDLPVEHAALPDPERRWRFNRGFWTFFTAAFFFDAGFAVFFFLFNLYLVDLHFSERAIGSVNAAMTLGSLLGTLPGGELTRRFGVRPLLLVCFTTAPLLGAARTLCMGVPAQTSLAFLMGLAMSGWGVCFLTAVSRLTTPKTRSSAFSLIFAVSIGTSALGGFLCSRLPSWIAAAGSPLSSMGSKRLLLLSSCITAATGLFAVLPLKVPAAASEQDTALSDWSGWREAWRLDAFLASFLPCMALWSGFLAVTGVFANVYLTRELGIPLSRLAMIFSVAQVLQFGASFLMPLLVRSFTRSNAIVLVQVLAALALCALGLTHAASLAVSFYLLLSVAQWMSSPVLYDMLMHATPDYRRGTVAAMTMFSNGLGGAAATALTGVLLTRFGYRAVLPCLAIAAMTIALVFRRANRDPKSQQLEIENPVR